jgi:hypothetical protein
MITNKSYLRKSRTIIIIFTATIICCNTDQNDRFRRSFEPCKNTWEIFKTRKELTEFEKTLSYKFKYGISISPKNDCVVDGTQYRIQFDYYAGDSLELPTNPYKIFNTKVAVSGFWSNGEEFSCSRPKLEINRKSNGMAKLKLKMICNPNESSSSKSKKIFIDGDFVFREYF